MSPPTRVSNTFHTIEDCRCLFFDLISTPGRIKFCPSLFFMMSSSTSALPASLRHMLLREPNLEYPGPGNRYRRHGSGSVHRLTNAQEEYYGHMRPTGNKYLRYDLHSLGTPVRASASLVHVNHRSNLVGSNALDANANHHMSDAHRHGVLPNGNYPAAIAGFHSLRHVSHADQPISVATRTAPLPIAQSSSDSHHRQSSLPGRHSNQPHNLYGPRASRAISWSETSYESINHSPRPGFISRATEACEACRQTKTRCYPTLSVEEGGHPAACRKCIQSNTQCVRTGSQRKRGPLRGSTRTVTGTGVRTGEPAGKRKQKRSFASKITRPRSNSAIPSSSPLAALSLLRRR